jgi:hypothetical protein
MEKRRRVRAFEDLLVWQMSIELVKRVYVLTASGLFSRDFGSEIKFVEYQSQFRQTSLKALSDLRERSTCFS